jgi:hypothetical protein
MGVADGRRGWWAMCWLAGARVGLITMRQGPHSAPSRIIYAHSRGEAELQTWLFSRILLTSPCSAVLRNASLSNHESF